MQLKIFQQKALDQLDRYLDALRESRTGMDHRVNHREEGERPSPDKVRGCPSYAWESLKRRQVLPSTSTADGGFDVPSYVSRTADSKVAIPHICLKVPTGGGKTMLGVAALERIKQDTGFVLWVVPTKAIYDQTIKSFRSREHPYRQTLERMSGGKVKLLQKSDRFTRRDVENYLCVMMLMLPSANRQKGKEFLKIFRDSSGYTSFFPEHDDLIANQELSIQHDDLEKNDTGDWVKQSLINVLKLIRPTVVLDEAHKAYGSNETSNRQFVNSINRLNPCFVLELSATPKVGISNILVNISGTELQQEEMIKLPIEIHSFSNSDWKHTLAEAREKLARLDADARKLQSRENRYIRPIALVRVQRTGEDQREQGYTHSEDVRTYLMKNLSVPEDQIKVQTSRRRELAGEDLLSERSAVRWVITKDALKEGWDCSFAYVLTLLDNTTATTAMTQMVGRVMRQPHARRIEQSDSLNRCYIYCYNKDVSGAVESVKHGLEKEGLTGLDDWVRGRGETDDPDKIILRRRGKYRRFKIFLPQVLHKKGRNKWRRIDYDHDILEAINWSRVNSGGEVNLEGGDEALEHIATVGVQGQAGVSGETLYVNEPLRLEYFVWRLIDMVPNPWQAARIAKKFIENQRSGKDSISKLSANRAYLSEVLRNRVKKEIDAKAERIFRKKIGDGAIKFHLEMDQQLNRGSFEVLASGGTRKLRGRDGQDMQRSLFSPALESNFNNLERNFALYLDTNAAIHWWHKIAARQGYFLHGWRRHRVYPDFLVCKEEGDNTLLIIETKGMHLRGNEDTAYKEKLLKILEDTYKNSLDRGELQVRGQPAAPGVYFRMMFEDVWREELASLLSA